MILNSYHSVRDLSIQVLACVRMPLTYAVVDLTTATTTPIVRRQHCQLAILRTTHGHQGALTEQERVGFVHLRFSSSAPPKQPK